MDWNMIINQAKVIFSYIVNKIEDPNTTEQITKIKESASNIIKNSKESITNIKETIETSKDLVKDNKEEK